MRYSEDGRGPGRWTLVTGATEVEETQSQARQARPPTPPAGRELAVIVPDVACRTRPSRTAWGWETLPVDRHVRTELADSSVAGDAWIFVLDYGCWALAAHTAAAGTDEHVLAIADRFLIGRGVVVREPSAGVHGLVEP